MAKKHIDRYTRRKDGRFFALVNTQKYDDNGKPIRIPLYSNISSLDLEQKVDELKYKLTHGLYVPPDDTTWNDYCDKWLKIFTVPLEQGTADMYKNAIEKHLKPCIGHLKVKDIVMSDIQLMINTMLDTPRQCEITLMTFKRIIKMAKKDKLIADIDIFDGLILPVYQETEKRALTTDEKEALKKAAFTNKQKAFVYILFYFGLRREEALALMQSDFIVKENILRIDKAVKVDEKISYIKDTKNKYSVRKIPIPEAVKSFLNDYIKGLDTLYLFTMKNGNLMTKSSYVKFWDGIVKKMNTSLMSKEDIKELRGLTVVQKRDLYPIKRLTAHIFRHNYATMLYYSDISLKKAIALMGHKDAKMIMQIYAHLDEEKENAEDKINRSIAL